MRFCLTLWLECNVLNTAAVCGLGEMLDITSNQYGESIFKISLSFAPLAHGSLCPLS